MASISCITSVAGAASIPRQSPHLLFEVRELVHRGKGGNLHLHATVAVVQGGEVGPEAGYRVIVAVETGGDGGEELQ